LEVHTVPAAVDVKALQQMLIWLCSALEQPIPNPLAAYCSEGTLTSAAELAGILTDYLKKAGKTFKGLNEGEIPMPDETCKPDAGPAFRRLAGGVAFVCFLLAAGFAFGKFEGDLQVPAYVCLAVGVVMAGIALTGNWPWWGRDKR